MAIAARSFTVPASTAGSDDRTARTIDAARWLDRDRPLLDATGIRQPGDGDAGLAPLVDAEMPAETGPLSRMYQSW